jgi:O-antigen ligase
MRFLLLFILVFAPIPFGSVHVWAYSAINMTVLGLGLWWLASLARDFVRRRPLPSLAYPATLPVALFFALVIFQLVPLPLAWIGVLSPKAFDIYLAVNQATGIDREFATLSLVPFETRLALVQGVVYVLLCYLVQGVFVSRKHVVSMVRTLIVIGAVVSLYGLFEKLSGHNHILWWKNVWAGRSFRIFGTFINPDHFGLYLELILPLSMAYVYRSRFHKSAQVKSSKRRKKLFRRILDLLQDEEAHAQKTGLQLFFTALMLVVLVMTGSRGAMLGIAAGFAVMAGLVFVKTRRKGFGVLLLVAILVAGIYGARIGLDPVIERWQKTEIRMDDVRLGFLKSAWPMIRDYPLFGTGLGTFEEAYPAYKLSALGQNRGLTHLHNDWAETLTDTGVLGLICVIWAYLALLIWLVKRWMRQSSTLAMAVGLGAIGALTCAGVHSLVDFGLRMPANGLTLAAIVGLAIAGMHTKERERVKVEGVRGKS